MSRKSDVAIPNADRLHFRVSIGGMNIGKKKALEAI